MGPQYLIDDEEGPGNNWANENGSGDTARWSFGPGKGVSLAVSDAIATSVGSASATKRPLPVEGLLLFDSEPHDAAAFGRQISLRRQAMARILSNPRTWIALLALACLAVAFLAWPARRPRALQAGYVSLHPGMT